MQHFLSENFWLNCLVVRSEGFKGGGPDRYLVMCEEDLSSWRDGEMFFGAFKRLGATPGLGLSLAADLNGSRIKFVDLVIILMKYD